MAEYLPLLERAVAGLQDSTAATRKTLYDRARHALLGQLRTIEPPVPESDIQRESVALDEAIARVEANVIAREANATADPGPVPVPAGPVVSAGPVASPASSEGRPAAPPPLPASPGPASTVRPAASVRPALPSRPTGGERGSAGPTGAVSPAVARGRPAYPFRNIDPGPAAPPVRPGVPLTADARGETPDQRGAPRLGAAVRTIEPAGAGGPRPDLNEEQIAPPIGLSAARDLDQTSADENLGSADPAALPGVELARTDARRRGRDASTARPAVPARRDPKPRRAGLYLTLGVLALLVGGVAVTAYRLRDRPEQVVAASPPVEVGSESSSKAINRVDSPVPVVREQSGNAGTPAEPATAPATSESPQSDAAALPNPIPLGSERATRGPQSGTTADASMAGSAPDPSTSTSPSIGVAQRAGLLVEAPEDPQKVKMYAGTVVWRMESVSAGQGQPLSSAVRADVDVPEAKLAMSMVLKRNVEPQFPASHTIELHFIEQPGNTLGPIKQVYVPELRRDDTTPSGDQLSGVPVSITDNYFLVGLSRGGAEQPNINLLTQRNWIDVSLQLASGKAAKVAFEKGAPGQKILEDALASWR